MTSKKYNLNFLSILRLIQFFTKRGAFMSKKISTLLLLLTIIYSCSSNLEFSYLKKQDKQTTQTRAPLYPEAYFMAISDPHLYDTSLGIEGEAFNEYLAADRKLLKESENIAQKALSIISKNRPQFLLVSGDLTKDGELSSHKLISLMLSDLEHQGIDVFVVPGNHDILNPDAKSFAGNNTKPVEQVSPEEFKKLYAQLGYDKAIEEDPNSLSYLAEPVPGLWLLALDSCRYQENSEKKHPVVGGRFTQNQIDWIESILQKAQENQKAVMVMMHHGIYEHYKGQKKYFSDYVIDEYQDIAEMFAFYKVRIGFTGHYHAQDIVKYSSTNNKDFIYDIETGSLVSYPNPIRSFHILQNQELKIQSYFIEDIEGLNDPNTTFPEYSLEYTQEGIELIAIDTMMSLGISYNESKTLSTSIAEAFMAHYAGDENFKGKEMLPSKGLSFMGNIVLGSRKNLVYELWQDTEPADNNITINLKTGEWY